MNTIARTVVQLVLVVALALPSLAWGQVLTEGGDPVMTVTDPATATPIGKQKAKTPPLAAGQQVLLVATKDGLATVSVNNPTANGMFNDYAYQLPLAALRYLPGKTHVMRPAWLPAPGPAGTEARDVVAYAIHGELFVRSDRATPRRIVPGRIVQGSYAVSPDGGLVAYSPQGRAGVVFLPLDGKTKPWTVGEGSKQPRGEVFSPDGSTLAWRADGSIQVLAVREPHAKPRTVARGLAPDAELQGFTSNSSEIVIADSESVVWFDRDGKKLRSLPPASFSNEGKDHGSTQYIPSPVDANWLLIACQTHGTPAYHAWANDVSGAIYIYDATSGSNYRLTPKHLAAIDPTWSPDGRRIYFSALPDTPANGPHHLYRMHADGTGLTDLGPGFAPKVGTRPQ